MVNLPCEMIISPKGGSSAITPTPCPTYSPVALLEQPISVTNSDSIFITALP